MIQQAPAVQAEPKAEGGWQAAALRSAKTATALAGPVFLVAYAFGLVAMAKFLGRYGLQATELLRARYLTIGLSAILLIAPTVLGLALAVRVAQQTTTPKKKWVKWALALLVSVVCGLATFWVWLVWTGVLTSFGTAPGSSMLTRQCSIMGVFAAFGGLAPFWLRDTDKTWLILMTVAWSFFVCSTLSNVLQYLPPWAGGFASPPVTVITSEPGLRGQLSGNVVLVEETGEHYIFWDKTADKLIEVPSQWVVAIIGGPNASESQQPGER
jgi:hypothetical protein